MVTAHAGHWYVSVLYLVPVLVIAGILTFHAWRDRRRGGPER